MQIATARRLVGAALVVPLLSLAPVSATAAPSDASAAAARPAPPAGGDVKTKKRCKPDKYETNYKILTAKREPKITHISAYFLPPTSGRTEKKKAELYLQLRSQVKLSSSMGVSASGIAKVLAKAETAVNMELKASGKFTARGSVVVKEYLRNTTRRNQKFVFFRGAEFASGTFRKSICKIYYLPGQSYGPAFVTYSDGKWQSYSVEANGALRCSGGQVDDGLGRLALAIGC